MTGGAAHQVGSQGVTVPNLTHPQPTVHMGQDERGVLPLVQSQEVQADVLLGLEQGVPPIEHPCDHPVSCKVSRYDRHTPCLNTSQGGKDVRELVIFQVHAIGDVVEMDCIVWMVLEPGHQHLANGKG
jgi:hypothetical protein